jgi:D-alanyl-D-alanine dipeptidase
MDQADPSPSPAVTASEPVAPSPERHPCELVDPPPGLVDLATLIPDAIIVAGYSRSDNFTGAPLPGYEVAGAWLEREAGEALVEAAAELASTDLRIIIYDGYRPRRASEAMVEWATTNERRWLLDDGWVAPKSAHNRGRAIDLGLADRHGVALDMGSAWDQFDARSTLRGVEGEPLERRLRLRAAMVDAGFVPYAREWWHFGFRSETVAPALDQPYACRR